ncbi:F-box/kelch-repeat protein-like protein [Drosera capensis]
MRSWSVRLPPARSGHILTCIDETRAVLVGGRGSGYEVMKDVWLFNASTGHLGWKQLLFDLKNVVGGTSIPGHSAMVVVGSRVLIYAGEDSDRHRKDDFWLLDVNLIETNGNPSSSASAMARRKIRIDGFKPNSRSFHAACADHSGRLLYVFGGMVDGLRFDR